MAFIALELEKNDSTDEWVSVLIEGFAQSNDNPLGHNAHLFTLTEARSPDPNTRLFIINTTWKNASRMWTIGFFGGLIAYIALNIPILLTIPVFCALTIYAFSNHFLELVARMSLNKHNYKGEKQFYSPEGLIELIGVRTLASTTEGDA